MDFKKILTLFVALLLLVSQTQTVFAAGKSAKVESYSGTVAVRRSGSEKDIKPFNGMTLQEGDKITTGKDGTIKISIDSNKYIMAGKSSCFTINSLKGSGDDAKTGFTLVYGSVYNEVNQPSNSNDTYTIKTANTVMGVRSTVFKTTRTLLQGKELLEVVVLDGTVYVSNTEDKGAKGPGTTDIDKGYVGNFVFDASGSTVVTTENSSVRPINVNELDQETKDWVRDNEAYVPDIAKEIDKKPGSSGSSGGGGGGGGSTGGGGSGNANELLLVGYSQSLDGATLTFTFNKTIDSNSTLSVTPAVSLAGAIDTTGTKIEVPAANFASPGTEYTIAFDNVKSGGRACSSGAVRYVGSSFVISDLGSLQAFHDGLVSSFNYYLLVDSIDATGHDFNGAGSGSWTPVNLNNKTFLGDGNTISGLEINGVSGPVGFFGALDSGAVVKELVLGDIDVSNITSSQVGVLAGRVNNSTIENCKVIDSGIYSVTGDEIGGIAGAAQAGAVLKNCVFEDGGIEIINASRIGGIVGDANNTTIENCTVKDGILQSQGSNLGGVVGSLNNNSTLINPLVTGERLTVQAIGSASTGVGGVAGNVSASTIQGNTQSGVRLNELELFATEGLIGGYAGTVTGAASDTITGARIETERVTVGDASTGTNAKLGGLFGDLNGVTATNCYLKVLVGEVSTNTTKAGGIVGGMDSNATLKQSSVVGGGEFKIEGLGSNAYVGGIAGDVQNGTIEECYIKGCALRTQNGGYIGGIAGYVSAGTIQHCYVAVMHIDSAASGIVGGLVGSNDGSINYCHMQTDLQYTFAAAMGTITGPNGGSGIVNNCIYLQDSSINFGIPEFTMNTGTILAYFLDTMGMVDTSASNTAYTSWPFGSIWTMGSSYPELINAPR